MDDDWKVFKLQKCITSTFFQMLLYLNALAFLFSMSDGELASMQSICLFIIYFTESELYLQTQRYYKKYFQLSVL